MNLHVQFHHLVHVERIDAACNRHAQRVTYKVLHVMVGEKIGKRLEDGTLLRLLHVVFHTEQSFLADFIEKQVHHLQQIQVARFAELRSAENALQSLRDALENVERIGYQQSA